MNEASSAAPAALPAAVLDRARGALVGLAVGDALGTTLEFSRRDTLPHHTDMTGGGPFRLQTGEWTDDTAMALALAASLIHCHGFDPTDLMQRFVSWYRHGQYSCTGTCFDIGITTREALHRFEQTDEPFAGSADPHTAGNGSLMRLAPVALFALRDEALALQVAADQSRTTHAAPAAVEACQHFVTLLRAAIGGESDIPALAKQLGRKYPALRDTTAPNWQIVPRDQIDASGFALSTLGASLWAVANTTTFEEALIVAVNLGQDADTTGAVCGQLAGAIYGASNIPARWLQHLAWHDRITTAADQLLAHATPPVGHQLSG